MDEKVIVDLLGQVGKLFTSSLELKETIDFMLKATADLVACDACTVFLVDQARRRLQAMSTFPYTDQVDRVASFEFGEGIVGWAALHRKVVSIGDATRDERFKDLQLTYAPRSVLVMPLESPRHLVGALTVTRKQVQPFTALEQALVQVIGNQAAISMDNSRLYNEQRARLAELAERKQELEVATTHIREISRHKSEFLASMSHELRTPLNAILGFSEILKDNLAGDLSTEQTRDCLESIHASGRHLLELVNSVLDLSKIEAGRMELTLERFRVADVYAEVQSVIRSLSERRSVELSADIEPTDLGLEADRGKVKQVLYNLLSNAIKFTPPGGRVWVRARERQRELVVEVGDTGIGIAHEQQELVFTEFHQVDSPLAREHHGTGLGLPLSRRLLQLHGGDIALESAPGEGTVFTLRLPVRQAEREGDGAANRILIVEDDPSNRELARMVLDGNGFRVDVAEDGTDGLAKVEENRYDLVLMDVKLPGIDGLTLCRQLKDNPRTAAVPVVALSAHAMKGDEQRALAAGCAGYITKPIEVARFVKQVSSYLEGGTA